MGLGGAFICPKPETGALLTRFEYGLSNGTSALGEPLRIAYSVENTTSQTIKATVAGSVSSLEGEVKHSFQKYVELKAGEQQVLQFSYQPTQANFYNVFVQVRNASGRLAANSAKMAYAPFEIKTPLTRKKDFEAFWNSTRLQLAEVAPRFKVIPKPSLDTKAYNVYLIEMQSLDNMTIRGWYRVPTLSGPHPVVLQLPSLGGSFFNVQTLAEKPRHGVPADFAVLSLNIRGHGNSKEIIDVGENYRHLVSYRLESRETYLYRGAVADALRALDFLATRPEIDTRRIVAEGGSQGGALSLIVAALDSRVKLCAPDVPFLSDIDRLLQYAPWFADEMTRYQKTVPELSLWRVQYNLSYFDTKNFAEKIKIPILMSLGLQDQTCPAITGLVTYNYIQAEKQVFIYPEANHEGGGELHRRRKFAWIREKWGM
ncbi:MAG: hypothetical protein OHK0053_23770 [Microscillaceae bacterium]